MNQDRVEGGGGRACVCKVWWNVEVEVETERRSLHSH